MTKYFVSQTGTGDVSGRDASNTAPVIAVLSDLTASKSSEISINVVGTISPPWNNWNNFLTNSAIGRRVYVTGGEIIVPTNPDSANNFPIVGNWELKNIIVSNGSAHINSASKLSLSGEIIWRTNSAQRFSINNMPGGRFDVYSANVEFQTAFQSGGLASVPLWNDGEMNFKDSNMWIAGVSADLMLANLGEVYSKNSKIGTQASLSGQRPLYAGIQFFGRRAKLISVGFTYVIGATATGARCWLDGPSGAYISKWAESNNYGSTLSFPAETTYAESSSTNPSSAYLTEAAERRLARENASGIIVCA
jgi:hypothetical protein